MSSSAKEVEDNYDYSGSGYFIEPFINPISSTPFIDNVVENYGTLWTFSKYVKSWSLSRSGKFVQVTLKVNEETPYVHLDRGERVTFVEQQRREYLVLGLQAFNESGIDLPHCHSIVVKVGDTFGQFDLNELLQSVVRNGQGSLKEALEKYLPWTNDDVEKVNRRLVRIHQLLSAFETRPVPVAAAPRRRPRGHSSLATEPYASESNPPQSTTRAAPRKASTLSPSPAGPSTKRQKSNPRGSSTSTVTRAPTPYKSRNDPQIDFQEITESQRLFWEDCRKCFPFTSTYSVNIGQCVPAKAQFVIRGMEEGIVRSTMDFLVQLGEVNQRQKLCICPIGNHGEPIIREPKSWDEIKDGKFMLINGQHSVEASKRLQENENYGEQRKRDLRVWDAYVVWTKDPLKLQRISKFYNDTNYLDHAQPTWGNQISSCRRIWLNSGRPTYQNDEGQSRRNGAVLDQEKYTLFSKLIVSRFQNIDPTKEGKQVNKSSDLTNEIKVITLPDEIFQLWETFLQTQTSGDIINPDSLSPYNEARGFKASTIHREFFKRLGHLTDQDLRDLFTYLVDSDRGYGYPKVTLRRSTVVHGSCYHYEEWVDRRKKKRIIMQELVNIDPSLQFLLPDGSINNNVWREWKTAHNVSSASYNMLLYIPDKEFFSMRLTNVGKLKRASHLLEKFPNVLSFFKKFLFLKNLFTPLTYHLKLREFDSEKLEFGEYFSPPTQKKDFALALLDLRMVPGWLSKDDTVEEPYFPAFLKAMKAQKSPPTMSSPHVWVWITSSDDRAKQALKYAEKRMSKYRSASSTYLPSATEHLNYGTSRSKVVEVYLLFLIKKDHPEADELVEKVKRSYSPVDSFFYMERSKYLEACFAVHGSELRMEFYLELLKDFCIPKDRVFGVLSGSKFMLANQMFGTSFYGLIDKSYRLQYKHQSKRITRLDINDFIHKDCAYLGPLPSNVAGAFASTSQAAPAIDIPSDRTSLRRAKRLRRPAQHSSERSLAISPEFCQESDRHTTTSPVPHASPFNFDPYGSNVGVDLSIIGPSSAIRTASPQPLSPVASAANLQPEFVVLQTPDSQALPDSPRLQPVPSTTTGPHLQDDSIIFLSDSSDDEGIVRPLECHQGSKSSQVDCLVEMGLPDSSTSTADFFFNAAGEAPAPGEFVKYEPGGDFFQHMHSRRLREQKEKQDILDLLEASQKKQAAMEAQLERQREDSSKEKELMASSIRAELQAQMQADLARILSQGDEISHAPPSAPLATGLPQSCTYPPIETIVVSEPCDSLHALGEIQQCSTTLPVVDSASPSTLDFSSAAVPNSPALLQVPPSLPDESSRPEDAALSHQGQCLPSAMPSLSPVNQQVVRDTCAQSTLDPAQELSFAPDQLREVLVDVTCLVKPPSEREDVFIVEEDRVDYEQSPQGPEQQASEEDKIKLDDFVHRPLALKPQKGNVVPQPLCGVEFVQSVTLPLHITQSAFHQVSKATADASTCKSDGTVLPSKVGFSSEYSGSFYGGVAQSHQSKPYLMCTATDAASMIMDFSKQSVDDGVVDSPPERRAAVSPVASPSPLKRVFSSFDPRPDCTPQRRLYHDDVVVDLNLVKGDLQNSSPTLAKQTRLPASRSQGAVRVVQSPIRSRGLQTQSVGVHLGLRSSGPREFRLKSVPSQVRGNGGAGSSLCRPSFPSEIRGDVDDDDYFKPYSRRKEIMIGYAKVKAKEASLLKG